MTRKSKIDKPDPNLDPTPKMKKIYKKFALYDSSLLDDWYDTGEVGPEPEARATVAKFMTFLGDNHIPLTTHIDDAYEGLAFEFSREETPEEVEARIKKAEENIKKRAEAARRAEEAAKAKREKAEAQEKELFERLKKKFA